MSEEPTRLWRVHLTYLETYDVGARDALTAIDEAKMRAHPSQRELINWRAELAAKRLRPKPNLKKLR